MRLECQTCGGQYDDVGADGVRYFHVCPPVTYVSVVRGKQAGIVQLANLQPTDLVTVLRDGAPLQVAAGATIDGDVRLGDTARPRPNARNENPIVVPGPKGPTATVTSEGLGTLTVVAIAPIAAPVILDAAGPGLVVGS